MPSHEHMVSAVHTYIDGFEKQDAEVISSLFAEDGSAEDPVGSPLVQGKTALREFYANAVSMGITLMLEGPVRTVADYAAFPFSIHMRTSKGHRRIDVIDLFRFNADGKIVEMRAFWGPDNNRRIENDSGG